MPKNKNKNNKELQQKILTRWPSICEFFLSSIVNYELLCNNTIYGGDCYGRSYCRSGCQCGRVKCKFFGLAICGCCYQNCPLCEKDPNGDKCYGCDHYVAETENRECETCAKIICNYCHDSCPICKDYFI